MQNRFMKTLDVLIYFRTFKNLIYYSFSEELQMPEIWKIQNYEIIRMRKACFTNKIIILNLKKY